MTPDVADHIDCRPRCSNNSTFPKSRAGHFRLCKSSHKRRNYLFVGSDSGAERAAALYSLVGAAKLNGMDPEAYLRHVLERIADHPITRIKELLPSNVATEIPLPIDRAE
jgi:hypothetical protein